MQEYFFRLADFIEGQLRGSEAFTANFSGEDSDFVRFNKGRVRQPGSVRQYALTIDLIDGERHTKVQCMLAAEFTEDSRRVAKLIADARAKLPHIPADPYLLVNTVAENVVDVKENALPDAAGIVQEVVDAAEGTDFVGIYAGGDMYSGFAGSYGGRYWFSRAGFNLDWSLFHRDDKAVKSAYAGFTWQPERFGEKMGDARKQLDVLQRPPKTIAPGNYRVYLTPTAVAEITGLLSWSAFGLKSLRTKQSPLIKLAEGEAALHPSVHLYEDTVGGSGPGFQAAGFIKPPRVDLISAGKLVGALASPRSAREYGVTANGASDGESPSALAMAAGELATRDSVSALDTGIYINNLWYLNFSDRNNCRITGMTRFATLWVENGEIVAPLNVMRFDESLYRMFGDHLEALTAERDLLLSTDTYVQRSTDCATMPGALIRDFRLTL